MSWIQVIDEEDAARDPEQARLLRLYQSCIDGETGTVDNILKVHSLRPETLDGHLRLYRAVMHPRSVSGLSGREREILGVVVSVYNGCHY